MATKGQATPQQALDNLMAMAGNAQRQVEDSMSKNVTSTIGSLRKGASSAALHAQSLLERVKQARRHDKAAVNRLENAVKSEFQALQRALRDDVALHTLRAETGRVHKAGRARVVRGQRRSHGRRTTGSKAQGGIHKQGRA